MAQIDYNRLNQNLDIYTESKDSISIQILSIKEFNYLIENNRGEVLEETKGFPISRPVYRLDDNSIVIKYTDVYVIKMDSYNDYLKITKIDDRQNIVSLILDKETMKFYYSFLISPKYIKSIIDRPHVELQDYGRDLSIYKSGGAKYKQNQYVIQFEDGSVLAYRNRTENVAQGVWCPNFEHFIYLYGRQLL